MKFRILLILLLCAISFSVFSQRTIRANTVRADKVTLNGKTINAITADTTLTDVLDSEIPTALAVKKYVDNNAVAGNVDSTRLVQDSILVYYSSGLEIGRDTLVSGGEGVTNLTGQEAVTTRTVESSTGTNAVLQRDVKYGVPSSPTTTADSSTLWYNPFSGKIEGLDRVSGNITPLKREVYLEDFKTSGNTYETAFSLAISALSENGILKIGKGNFSFPTEWSSGYMALIDKSITIEGEKANTIFNITGSASTRTFFNVQADNVTISGIVFNCSGSFPDLSNTNLNSSNRQIVVAQTIAVKDLTVENCKFINTSTAIKVNDSETPKILDCVFEQCMTNVLIQNCKNALIDGMESNRDSLDKTEGFVHHIYINSSANTKISNCNLRGGAGQSINLKTDGLPAISTNTTITNCVFDSTGTVFVNYAKNTTISNCHWKNTGGVVGAVAGKVIVNNMQWINETGVTLPVLQDQGWPVAGYDTTHFTINGGELKGPMRLQTAFTKGIEVNGVTITDPLQLNSTVSTFYGTNSSSSSVLRVNDSRIIFYEDLAGASPQLIGTGRGDSYWSNVIFENNSSVNFGYVSLSNEGDFSLDVFDNCKIKGGISRIVWNLSSPNSYRVKNNCVYLETGEPTIDVWADRTADYTTRGESIIRITGGDTITLSSTDLAYKGWTINLLSSDGNEFYINSESGNIDGVALYSCSGSVTLRSDGTNWEVVSTTNGDGNGFWTDDGDGSISRSSDVDITGILQVNTANNQRLTVNSSDGNDAEFISLTAPSAENGTAGMAISVEDDLTTPTFSALKIQATANSGWGNIGFNPLGGNIGVQTIEPTQPLDVNGNFRLRGSFYDFNNEAGTAGQILSNTGTGTDWIAPGSYTGWADYTDTTYNETSTLALTDGVKITLPNQAQIIRDTEMPIDIDSMYNRADTTIIGRDGDGLNVLIEFKVKPTSPAGTRITTSIDIGGSVGEIYTRDFVLSKGNGVTHYYTSSVAGYTLGTWEANGGKVKVMATGGSAEIWDIRFVLTRTHKARGGGS